MEINNENNNKNQVWDYLRKTYQEGGVFSSETEACSICREKDDAESAVRQTREEERKYEEVFF